MKTRRFDHVIRGEWSATPDRLDRWQDGQTGSRTSDPVHSGQPGVPELSRFRKGQL